ncbi:MAG: DUF2235 domain-containing protein, partial [Pseudomonadota bacterium]
MRAYFNARMGGYSMKVIGVFCDGTWNNKDKMEDDTSVGRVFNHLEPKQSGELKVRYIPGVGSEEQEDDPSWRARWRKISGGALGAGLTENILEGYRYISETFEPGDTLYIFGFSRGAYTARSLGGLLRSGGLPSGDTDLREALSWYRSDLPHTHPRHERSYQKRLEISPRYYTSKDERDWRKENGHAVGDPLSIAYMGIFDTVGAHGVGGVAGQFRISAPGGHGFHDHDLSRSVLAGRHALALDETRVLFRPTLWSNLDDLNDHHGRYKSGATRYLQEWFPGDHGIVGGGGRERQIGNLALQWILDGAQDAGFPDAMPPDLAPDPTKDYRGALTNDSGFSVMKLIRWAR